jgi:hypothetical protein
MQNLINKKVLITTSNWFTAPDGVNYKAVWGTLKSINEAGKTLGFIPNRAHANWYIEIGCMFIMGCQALYVVQADEVLTGDTKSWSLIEGKFSEYDKPTVIFNADKTAATGSGK